MPVRLRLAPRGVKHSPVYDVVAVRQSKRVAAQPIEVLGRYDPIPKLVRPATRNLLQPLQEPQWEKELVLNSERVGYWLSVGAQPSERVRWLLKVAGLEKAKKVAKPASTSQATTPQGPSIPTTAPETPIAL